MPQPQVFISYCHRDRTWNERLLSHLRPLEKAGLLSVWQDGQLGAGVDWLHEIEAALSIARVAILLISADFLGSDFILRKEVPEILRRRARDGLSVIPVLIKPCYWEKLTWLSSMQLRPLYGKPLAAHSVNQRDTQLSAIAAEVMGYLEPKREPYHKAEEEPARRRSHARGKRSAYIQIAPLENNVDIFLDGTQVISTLDGLVLNSGRFLERYLEIARQKGTHLGRVRFVVPSSHAIRSAYRSKPKPQEEYLSETVRHIQSAWKLLERQNTVDSVEFRRIDCVPRNLCVIKNKELVLTGLYEPDENHPLGLTCRSSWLHSHANQSEELCHSYIEWFNSLWEESSPIT
jgi:hypothetical protein